MNAGDAARYSLDFWHWWPRRLCEGMSDEQLRWQPAAHSNNILWSVWHTFRAEDAFVSRIAETDAVHATGEWSGQLPDPSGWGAGNEMTREDIAALPFDIETVLSYGQAVQQATQQYLDRLSDEQAEEVIELPVMKNVFGHGERGTRPDYVMYFAVGHVAAHLGEAQYIKGLMGLQGAAV